MEKEINRSYDALLLDDVLTDSVPVCPICDDVVDDVYGCSCCHAGDGIVYDADDLRYLFGNANEFRFCCPFKRTILQHM